MKNKNLENKTIALLVSDGFEESELAEPRKFLDEQGAKTVIVSPEKSRVKSWKDGDWGKDYPVDLALEDASSEQFNALILPGGVINPDKLRINPHALQFIRDFYTTNKIIAAICHGPWTLINAHLVKGYHLTSWPSIKIDLLNAGAHWTDEAVVIDGKLITSRKPEDIPAFNNAILELLTQLEVTS